MKQARTKLVTDDSRNGFPRVQITYTQRVSDASLAEPYGIHGSPPINTACLLISINGDEGNKYVIPLSMQTRKKNLKEGEFVTGNFKIGSIIYFDETGKVTVDAPEITLGRTLLELIVKGTKLKDYINNQIKAKYDPHTHPGNTLSVDPTTHAVTGSTGGPSNSITSATEADLASAKHKVGE